MGKRGRNKTGYYRVLLHLLELQYSLEERARDHPARWRPSPRNRPDQFLRWVRSSLTCCSSPGPLTLDGLLERLEKERLPHIAALLEHVTRDHTPSAGTSKGFETLLAKTQARAEAHPQARKFAGALSRSLDAAWLAALQKTEAHAAVKGWPAVAVILGGLPPGFGAVYTLLQSGLSAGDAIESPAELSVFGFYGLATGTLPPPPAPFKRALSALGSLTPEDVTLLSSLSEAQVLQVRGLPSEAFSAGNGAPHCAKYELLDEPLNEELRRLMTRKELGGLAKALRGGDAPWREARALLTEAPWATLYLEDQRTLQELFDGRTAAKLNLRDVFPRTTAWLDERLETHIESALYVETGEVRAAAHAYSCHARKLLLGARRP